MYREADRPVVVSRIHTSVARVRTEMGDEADADDRLGTRPRSRSQATAAGKHVANTGKKLIAEANPNGLKLLAGLLDISRCLLPQDDRQAHEPPSSRSSTSRRLADAGGFGGTAAA
jgi:hypothetical protein